MNIQELIYELGDNVERKRAKVEEIKPVPGSVWMHVRILDPSLVSVDRIETWLVKMDGEQVKCMLVPERFPINRTLDFTLAAATFIPDVVSVDLQQAILDAVKVSDELTVLHVRPAVHAGKYCKFEVA